MSWKQVDKFGRIACRVLVFEINHRVCGTRDRATDPRLCTDVSRFGSFYSFQQVRRSGCIWLNRWGE
jgi:hypothetical protein